MFEIAGHFCPREFLAGVLAALCKNTNVKEALLPRVRGVCAAEDISANVLRPLLRASSISQSAVERVLIRTCSFQFGHGWTTECVLPCLTTLIKRLKRDRSTKLFDEASLIVEIACRQCLQEADYASSLWPWQCYLDAIR